MTEGNIGVVGNGFVGGAIVKGFSTYRDVYVHDANPKRSLNSLDELLTNSQFVFVCLPTPMISAEGGHADLSIIRDFFFQVSEYDNLPANQVFIIKSTVPVGTTREIAEQFDIPNIIHCPEFLTARTANLDFISSSRNIVGGIDGPNDHTSRVKELLDDRFPGTPVYETSSNESELIKYASNCFFATKVIFFNEMRLLSDELGLNWDNVIQGIISDGRIGQSHHQVPGHDGDYGFGGTCFPKDINALIRTMEENGMDSGLLKAVWEENKRIRKNWDWATQSSAVSNAES